MELVCLSSNTLCSYVTPIDAGCTPETVRQPNRARGLACCFRLQLALHTTLLGLYTGRMLLRVSLRNAALAAVIIVSSLPAQQRAETARAIVGATEAQLRIQRLVEAIAAADSIEGRRDPIVARLRAMGLEPQLVTFDPPASSRAQRRGTNVIARVPGRASNTLLLGAHYDRVPRGRGVIDNASGVAAVLELAEAFARQPLAHYVVEVAFWDLEESGLLGARARVADSLRAPLPQIYVNFDIFGYGDMFWVGALKRDDPFPRRMEAAARTAGMGLTIDSLYPPSDHLRFRSTSTQSFAVSILGADDVTKVLEMLRSGGSPTGEPPAVLRILHTDADTMDKLDAAAVARGVRVVEAAIRALDAALRSPTGQP
jgi:aminopeptidase S